MAAESGLNRILIELADAEVDFVAIGAVAVIAHGHIRTTLDVDITYDTAPGNLEALGRFLVAVDARLRGVAEVVPFIPDDRTLSRVEMLTLESRVGSIDLLVMPPGAPPYADLRDRAMVVDLEGREVRVAGIDDLIAMKRAAGRPRDFDDIDALEALVRAQRAGSA